MLEVTRRILDANGYTVLTAGRGGEAIKPRPTTTARSTCC